MFPGRIPLRLNREAVSARTRLATFGPSVRGLSAGLVLLFGLITEFAPAAHAQLASKSAQEWLRTLDSSNRVAHLKIDDTIAKLGLHPGDTVADIGAGSGLFSLPLARAVQPGGKVYAVDIEQGLLDHIDARAKALGLTNVQTVLGKFSDPALPESHVDLAFVNDVLHHIEDRAAYLKNLAHYLKPDGRIVMIDFIPNLGPHRNQPKLQVPRKEADAWLSAIGFKPVEEYDLFRDKWFVIYKRDQEFHRN